MVIASTNTLPLQTNDKPAKQKDASAGLVVHVSYLQLVRCWLKNNH